MKRLSLDVLGDFKRPKSSALRGVHCRATGIPLGNHNTLVDNLADNSMLVPCSLEAACSSENYTYNCLEKASPDTDADTRWPEEFPLLRTGEFRLNAIDISRLLVMLLPEITDLPERLLAVQRIDFPRRLAEYFGNSGFSAYYPLLHPEILRQACAEITAFPSSSSSSSSTSTFAVQCLYLVSMASLAAAAEAEASENPESNSEEISTYLWLSRQCRDYLQQNSFLIQSNNSQPLDAGRLPFFLADFLSQALLTARVVEQNPEAELPVNLSLETMLLERELQEQYGFAARPAEWSRWLVCESYRRLFWCLMLLDRRMSLLAGEEPQNFHGNLRFPLPDRESLWRAGSASEWRTAYGRALATFVPYYGTLLTDQLFRSGIDGAVNQTPSGLELIISPIDGSNFATHVLLYGVASHLQTVQRHYTCNSLYGDKAAAELMCRAAPQLKVGSGTVSVLSRSDECLAELLPLCLGTEFPSPEAVPLDGYPLMGCDNQTVREFCRQPREFDMTVFTELFTELTDSLDGERLLRRISMEITVASYQKLLLVTNWLCHAALGSVPLRDAVREELAKLVGAENPTGADELVKVAVQLLEVWSKEFDSGFWNFGAKIADILSCASSEYRQMLNKFMKGQ